LRGAAPLKELAAACGLSVSHFSRGFRKSFGIPHHAWLLRARVDHAKMLLRQPGRTLSEIALICGFADHSHFTRVFRERVGTAPTAWRSACLA
jgi:AraC family transcriptional regulator